MKSASLAVADAANNAFKFANLKSGKSIRGCRK